jgi:hypothetical protein
MNLALALSRFKNFLRKNLPDHPYSGLSMPVFPAERGETGMIGQKKKINTKKLAILSPV